MPKKTLPLIIFVLILSLVACAPAMRQLSNNVGSPESVMTEMVEVAPQFEAPAPKEVPASGDFAQGALSEKSSTDTERIVITNGYLELVVSSPDKSMETIRQMAEALGGYVVSATLTKNQLGDGTEVPRASITIRVPAEKFNEAITKIEAESDQLPRNKNISSQDITLEYTDLESQLRNLEAAEKQLMTIMEDAVRTEDVLNVYNQLVQVRGQIEVIKGQMKYYDESAKLSAISVELIASAAEQPITIGGWQPVGVVKDAINTLISALQRLVEFLIWLFLFIIPILLVILIPIGLIILIIWAIARRRKAKRESKTTDITTGTG